MTLGEEWADNGDGADAAGNGSADGDAAARAATEMDDGGALIAEFGPGAGGD